ncbi:hypothetical protein BpHYR1_029893 [Brachionus plicatilis]|uniref:Uncharacterized protein n=1 Tax=Brachionus plicatilis TaxID=10195 RepID=A0A3M7RFM5_BRAPC|nr:hypothetical protein BpHYR1_029893 [Brachionus plicatilis]
MCSSRSKWLKFYTHKLTPFLFKKWEAYKKTRSTELKNLPILFSNEKKFTVDGGLNKQNLRVYALSRDEADINGTNY